MFAPQDLYPKVRCCCHSGLLSMLRMFIALLLRRNAYYLAYCRLQCCSVLCRVSAPNASRSCFSVQAAKDTNLDM